MVLADIANELLDEVGAGPGRVEESAVLQRARRGEPTTHMPRSAPSSFQLPKILAEFLILLSTALRSVS